MQYSMSEHAARVLEERALLPEGLAELRGDALEAEAQRGFTADDYQFVDALAVVYAPYGPETVAIAVERFYVYKLGMRKADE